MFINRDQPHRAPSPRRGAVTSADEHEVQLLDAVRLQETTLRVAEARDRATAARELLQGALAAVGATQGLLSFARSASEPIRVAASVGLSREFIERVEGSGARAVAGGTAFRQRERVVVDNAPTDPLFAQCRNVVELGGFVACHCVPLLAGGELLGVLAALYAEKRRPDEREKRLLDGYAQTGSRLLALSRPAERVDGKPARPHDETATGAEHANAKRREADDIVRESEVRFRMLASHAPVGIFVSGEDMRCSFVNEHWCELSGQSPVAATEGRWSEVVHPEDRRDVRESWNAAFRARTPWAAEFRFRRSDGAIFWLQGSAVPLRVHGTVEYIGTVVDITDRQKTEQEARYLAAIVEASHDAIVGKDLNGIIASWNEAAERLFGYTAEEVVGRPVTILIPPDRQGEEPKILRRLRGGEQVEHFETVRVRKDGAPIDVSLTISPIRDARGKIIGASKIARDITRQRRAELELRRREKLYRAIGESMNYGVWVCDASGQRIYTSESFLRLVGMTAAEVAFSPWSILPESEAAECDAAWRDCVRIGAFWEREFRVRGSDGRMHAILARGVPIRDDDGAIAYWAGINLDVSAFKQAQEKLETQTRTLSQLNELSSALVAERDLPRIIQMVTEAARAIGGADYAGFFYRDSGGEADGFPVVAVDGAAREHFAAWAPVRRQRLFAPLFHERRTLRIDDVAHDPLYRHWAALADAQTGGLVVRSYLAVPVVSRSGEVVGGVFLAGAAAHTFTAERERIVGAVAAQAAIAIDNAALYSALERELDHHKNAEQALRASEQQLRLVTDNAIVFLAQCDRAHRLKFVNRPYAERFGRKPQELVGQHVRDVVGAPAYAIFGPQIDAALAGERVEFETEIPYENAGLRWMRVLHEPERAANGEVTGVIAVITDITGRKQVEREMEAARDRALAASRAKDDFLAALSHELRTPLNPVLLLASEAANDPKLPEDARTTFEVIRKNIELEARLIDDLLDLTRITRGKLALTLGVERLHVILEDVLQTMAPEVAQKRLRLTQQLSPADPLVWADAVRIQQVLWNVLKNAVKFTPDGGAITVQTRLDSERHLVVVEIVDSGIGMTDAELARVFEAFAQGEHAASGGSHRFGGLGLGLAISKMLTELHHGSIRAVSDGRNRGACFILELPLCTSGVRGGTASGFTRTSTSAPPAPTERRISPRNILLVEDHDPTRAALTQLLTRRGHRVFGAGNVADARVLAQRSHIDLLVSDIGLPDGDGYGLMAELRRGDPELVGVALTGYGMENDVARSQNAGFTVHLTKPVTIQSLDQALLAACAATP